MSNVKITSFEILQYAQNLGFGMFGKAHGDLSGDPYSGVRLTLNSRPPCLHFLDVFVSPPCLSGMDWLAIDAYIDGPQELKASRPYG